jgi:uncharacterized protein YbbK (DUF523 family)
VERWEYLVVTLRRQQYTAALNEYGREGWELVSVVSEAVAAATPERAMGLPLPRALGRIEEAAGKLNKLGADDAAEPSTEPASRMLWVFRRPLGDD